MPGPDHLLSLPEVAALKRVTRTAVLGAVRDGRIPATRVGRFWVVRQRDAEAYVPRMDEVRRRATRLRLR